MHTVGYDASQVVVGMVVVVVLSGGGFGSPSHVVSIDSMAVYSATTTVSAHRTLMVAQSVAYRHQERVSGGLHSSGPLSDFELLVPSSIGRSASRLLRSLANARF